MPTVRPMVDGVVVSALRFTPFFWKEIEVGSHGDLYGFNFIYSSLYNVDTFYS